MTQRPDSSLRICIAQGAFLPVPPRLGGAVEKAWFSLGQEFARQGHTVTHIGRSYPGLADDEHEAGVHYRRVRGYDTPRSTVRLKCLDLLYSLRVRRVLPPADILVTNTFWLPLLERRRDRGRVYVHVARYPKGQLRFYPRLTTLQTVSAPIRDAILDEVDDASARVRVVPYPLAPKYLVEREAQPAREILYAGRLHPEKGIHLLIEAFAQLRQAGHTDWTLRIVGPWETKHGGGGEDYRRDLLRQACTCGDAVIFSGPVFDEAQLVSYYRRAAVFAYPSLAEKGETFGLAVLEAMAAGCAPVVSALACFADFVRDGHNGRIFNHRVPRPDESLAQMLGSLLRQPAQMAALRESAWQTARRYTLPSVASRFSDDFHALAAG